MLVQELLYCLIVMLNRLCLAKTVSFARIEMVDVRNTPLAQARYDLLVQACNSVASYQLRNRATLGGNICNASPAADTAPALYCLGAVVEIFNPHGSRRVQQARPDKDRRYLDGERGGVRVDEGRRTNDESRNSSFVIRHES